MTEVTAKQSFDHNGARRRGEKFTVSKAHAEALEKAGLVSIGAVEEEPSDSQSEPTPGKTTSRRKTKQEAE